MAFAFLTLVLSALVVQGAVLNSKDSSLDRVARSSGCDKCEGHPPPPPPPPLPPISPFGNGVPFPPSRSESSATSRQESSYTHSYKETKSSEKQVGNGLQQSGFHAISSASAQAFRGATGGVKNNAAESAAFLANQQRFKNEFQNKKIETGSSSLAQAGGVVRGDKNAHKDTKFLNNQQVGNGFQNKGFEAGSSSSAQSVGVVGGHKNVHKDTILNNQQVGNGFQNKRFKAGSSYSAHSGGVVGGDKNAHKDILNSQQVGNGLQNKGFKAESSVSAQAAVAGFHKNTHKDTESTHQQVGNGFQNKGFEAGASNDAIGSLKQAQGEQSAGKQECRSCGKGNYAVSNAKSNSGTAVAVAVNSG